MRELSARTVHGQELAETQLGDALADSSVRLVTVTGFGGVGKSLLAARAVSRLQGVRTLFVRLADVDRAELVVDVIVGQVRGADDADDPEDALIRSLGTEPTVLLLDGAEQLRGEADELAMLLDECPALRIVATSRVPLGLPGETVVRLEPFPAAAPDRSTDELLDDPAVALFLRTAAASGHVVGDDRPTVEHVVTICRLLEGIPAAIELAATMAGALSPAMLAARLEHGRQLSLLGGSGQSGRGRPTFVEVVGTTLDLLTSDQLELLVQLSVFAGWFTLESMVAVCGGDVDTRVDTLAHLVDAHVIEVAHHAGSNSFRVRRLVREAARDRLAASATVEREKLEHALASECRRAMNCLATLPTTSVLQRAGRPHDVLHDDTLALLHQALDVGDEEVAVELALGLAPVWWTAARSNVNRDLLRRTHSLAREHGVPPAQHAMLQAWSAVFASEARRADSTVCAHLARACELADESADPLARLVVYCNSVMRSSRCDRQQEGLALAHRGLAIADEIGDEPWAVTFQIWIAMMLRETGHPWSAADVAARALARARAVDDPVLEVRASTMLTTLPADVPAVRNARDNAGEIIELARSTADVAALSWLLPAYGMIRLSHGDVDQAVTACIEGLQMVQRSGSVQRLTLVLRCAATVAAHVDSMEIAARLHGTALRSSTLARRSTAPDLAALYDDSIERALIQLGADAFDRLLTRGAADPWNEAAASAIAFLTGLKSTTGPAASDHGATTSHAMVPLTERECEVVTLLAQGVPNKEIGRALGITTKTVMHHTSSIYRKLGVRGRAGAAAWAARTPM